VSRKEDVWMLFDNIDKGWPVTRATPEDIMIVKCLLAATRKIQRQFERRDTEFHSVIFIRNDIYQHLILDPADRGKETAVLLEWNDPDIFRDIIRRRIAYSTNLDKPFDIIWPHFFETHVGGQESFSYVLDRTLMRPREVLRFIRECINAAVNRGHDKVTQDDILQAEKTYSDDLLVDITLEMRDVAPDYADIPYAFIGCAGTIAEKDVRQRLAEVNVKADGLEEVISLLLWFGFLGIRVGTDEERYSYQFKHDLNKMRTTLRHPTYCIHPGFRKTLGCGE
jgi:hypothetical protein